MVSKEDFRNNNILGTLSDHMLDKLIPLAQLVLFDEYELVFSEGDPVQNFYLVKSGTVLIEHKLSDKITVTAGTVTTGESFGYSSLLGEEIYSTSAICATPCEIIVFDGETVVELLNSDHSMGFFIMQNIVKALGKRLQRRTDQFLRAIMTHPEIDELKACEKQ